MEERYMLGTLFTFIFIVSLAVFWFLSIYFHGRVTVDKVTPQGITKKDKVFALILAIFLIFDLWFLASYSEKLNLF